MDIPTETQQALIIPGMKAIRFDVSKRGSEKIFIALVIRDCYSSQLSGWCWGPPSLLSEGYRELFPKR
jgi:hypothetical protein